MIAQVALDELMAARDPLVHASHSVTSTKRSRAPLLRRQSGDEGNRPDDELAYAVRCALKAAKDDRLRPVTVTADNGRVQLNGRVRNYYAMQLAQHTAMSVAGVQRVLNDLIVE